MQRPENITRVLAECSVGANISKALLGGYRAIMESDMAPDSASSTAGAIKFLDEGFEVTENELSDGEGTLWLGIVDFESLPHCGEMVDYGTDSCWAEELGIKITFSYGFSTSYNEDTGVPYGSTMATYEEGGYNYETEVSDVDVVFETCNLIEVPDENVMSALGLSEDELDTVKRRALDYFYSVVDGYVEKQYELES